MRYLLFFLILHPTTLFAESSEVETPVLVCPDTRQSLLILSKIDGQQIWKFDFFLLPIIKTQMIATLKICGNPIAVKPLQVRIGKSCSNDFNVFEDDLSEAEVREYSTLAVKCMNAISSALMWEHYRRREHTETITQDADFIAAEIKARSTIAINAAKDPKVQLAKLKESESLAKIYSTDSWYPAVFIGSRMMPEYDESGNNQGFRESNLTGRFVLDSKKNYSDITIGTDDYNAGHNLGVELELLSESIVNCEQLAASDPDIDQADCEAGVTPVSDLEFNDIANTISASVYGWWSAYRSKSGLVEIGPGYRLGIQSREKLTASGDSINRFQGPGVRWVFNDLVDKNSGIGNSEQFVNGIPKFEIEYYRMDYEDYLGIGREQKRHYLRAFFRPTDLPVLMGLTVNGGKGPDEISLTLEYGIKVEKLLEVF